MTSKEKLEKLNNCVYDTYEGYWDWYYKVEKICEEHDKYKRAFDVFKRLDGPGRALLIAAIFDIATDEEYEILEELMGNDK